MKSIVIGQRLYFNQGHTRTFESRIKQLKTLKQALIESEALLAEAIYKDFKKSSFDNFSNELALLFLDIDEAIAKVSAWAKPKRVITNLINLPGRSYILPEPLGVCLVIGAWNYPYQLCFAPAIAAIAAGNTVIIKPSELASHSSRAIRELVAKYFDPNFLTVVEGGIEETTELLAQKFDKVFFTGSTKVGRIVYEAAAKHLTPVTLELGGKSPAIISKHCNIKITAKRIVWSKFLNAGQTCVAPDYLLVQTEIKEQLIEALITEIKAQQIRIENGNYVQIVNQRNFERLLKLIDPQKVIFGGNTNASERWIEPTIMDQVNLEDKVMEEEIFGPILPILTYHQLEEAIKVVKELPKPLACYMFSNNNKEVKQITENLSFGGATINEGIMHLTNSHLPFGGVGESGFGSYHGEAGFKAFSHYKSILKKLTWFEPNLKYYPHSNWKVKLLRWVAGIK
jgi:aldehyde dehydrogenase (NAD+)